jgi:hypothetical protein
MEAKAEKEADDEKIERPLAETMVREGYLAHKGPALAERAIDHTKMSATTIKEIAGLASVKLQVFTSCLLRSRFSLPPPFWREFVTFLSNMCLLRCN